MTGNNHDIQRDDRRCRHCERQSGECAVRCHDCDGWLCDDCARTCNECGSRMCGDCAYCCEHCEHSLCEDCGYRCRMCDDRLCSDCQEYCEQCDERYCPYCYERHACANTQDPCYRDPYEGRPVREPFTFGLEIEVDGNHDTDMLRNHRLIAGWCPDGSLHHDGSLEYQSEPMTMSQLTEIRRLVERIATDTDNTLSGGHMHISRTGRQTPARWYWALEALDGTQCEALNMRHMTDTRWCELIHGDYCGKDTAINDTHAPPTGPMPARPADRAARPPAIPPHGARQGRARQKHRGLAFFGPSKHTRVGEPVNAAAHAAGRRGVAS